jgi:hypothetical protein
MQPAQFVLISTGTRLTGYYGITPSNAYNCLRSFNDSLGGACACENAITMAFLVASKPAIRYGVMPGLYVAVKALCRNTRIILYFIIS